MARRRLMDYSKYIMLLAGAWKQPFFKTSIAKNLYYCYSIFVYTFFGTSTILMILSLFFTMHDKDYLELAEDARVVITCFQTEVKCIASQTDRMIKLIAIAVERDDEISKNTDKRIESIHDGYVKINTKIANTISFFIVCASVFLSVPVIVIAFITDSHPMMFPLYLPFDPIEYYGWTLLIQIITVAIGGITLSCTQIFYVSIMNFAALELKILQHKCRNFDQYRQNMQDDTSMAKQIIEDHQFIIEFVNELNEAIQYVLLFEFLLGSINIANIAFQLIAGKSITDSIFYAAAMSILVIQIFSLAWHANEIALESMRVAQAVYESQWYDKSLSVQKMLLLMQMRAQKPLMLTLGPFGAYTNVTAVSVFKTAYTFVTIMIGDD